MRVNMEGAEVVAVFVVCVFVYMIVDAMNERIRRLEEMSARLLFFIFLKNDTCFDDF